MKNKRIVIYRAGNIAEDVNTYFVTTTYSYPVKQ
jgi:hypothetical protein